jgi:hypothetical protein
MTYLSKLPGEPKFGLGGRSPRRLGADFLLMAPLLVFIFPSIQMIQIRGLFP